MFLIGISFIIDINAINLPISTPLESVIDNLRLDAIVGILGIALTSYGFLHTQENTRLYTERVLIYYFIFGIAVASYYFYPFSVQWIEGIGWQYTTLPTGLMILDQLIFIPIVELGIHVIRRLRAPVRTKKSRFLLWIFALGLSFLIIANVVSYFTDLLYYWGIAIGFGLMGYVFVQDPLILPITHVKIYDLVVSVNAVAVARFNFEKKEAIRSEHLLSGAFSGISTLIGETISTKTELKLLQTEDKTVLMHRSRAAKIYLVTNRLDDICLLAMQRLGRFVDNYYRKRDNKRNENIDPALFEREVLKIFTFA